MRAFIFVAGMALATLAGAQTWPANPVQIVVPTHVGSDVDLLARILGAKLAERWRQQVAIVNKVGAGTVTGTAEVAKSPPDGYNMVLVSDAFANDPALVKLPFDPVSDLTPVAQVALGAMVLCVHPSMPVKSVGDFVDYVYQHREKVTYGSAGNGTTHHMFMAMFAHRAGLDLVHVPYGAGLGEMQNDLVEGRLNAAFLASNAALPLVKANRLRAVAVAADQRMSYWPEVRTFGEQTHRAFELKLWYGLLAAGGTPRPIADKIYGDVVWALGLPDVQERLVEMGMEPAPLGPDAFAQVVHSEIARRKKLAQDAGIKAE